MKANNFYIPTESFAKLHSSIRYVSEETYFILQESEITGGKLAINMILQNIDERVKTLEGLRVKQIEVAK